MCDRLVGTEHQHVIDVQLSEWLRGASMHQALNPFSRSFFKKEADQQPRVSEIDGSAARDIFTVMCVGEC